MVRGKAYPTRTPYYTTVGGPIAPRSWARRRATNSFDSVEAGRNARLRFAQEPCFDRGSVV